MSGTFRGRYLEMDYLQGVVRGFSYRGVERSPTFPTLGGNDEWLVVSSWWFDPDFRFAAVRLEGGGELDSWAMLLPDYIFGVEDGAVCAGEAVAPGAVVGGGAVGL